MVLKTVKNHLMIGKNFLLQDRIINCELFPSEKLNENKYLKSDPSSDTDKEFIDPKKNINNYDYEKLDNSKKFKTFFTDLSYLIFQIQLFIRLMII